MLKKQELIYEKVFYNKKYYVFSIRSDTSWLVHATNDKREILISSTNQTEPSTLVWRGEVNNWKEEDILVDKIKNDIAPYIMESVL